MQAATARVLHMWQEGAREPCDAGVNPIPASPLTPYSSVLTLSNTMPLITAMAAGNGKQLVFCVDMPAGALVFTERPLVEDAVLEASAAERALRHNDRPAWSIVEQCLTLLPRHEIDALLAAGYARDVTAAAAQGWEAPGDERALAYMCSTFPTVDAALVRHLYDVVGTNNIIASTTLVPGATGVVYEIPLRYGFFALLSRANHACSPSVRLAIPRYPFAPLHCVEGVSVYTTRTVRAGEPLTFDYIVNSTREAKRTTLMHLFGFRCACDTCVTLCTLLECREPGAHACPCHRARYCSAAHQRADWARHKKEEHVV